MLEKLFRFSLFLPKLIHVHFFLTPDVCPTHLCCILPTDTLFIWLAPKPGTSEDRPEDEVEATLFCLTLLFPALSWQDLKAKTSAKPS